MKIVVVYESLFGNTKAIAEAIAEGMRDAAVATLASVDEISPADAAAGAALVVAGGPTHGHGMARSDAHVAVAKMDPMGKYGPVLPGEKSLRDWLEELPATGGAAASFDTRFDKPAWLTGSAAKKIARRLEGKGYEVLAVESFFVAKTGGPLAAGERERAVAWGRTLAGMVARSSAA